MKAPTTSEISHNSHGAKSVLVTGATRGIGRAIADELGRDHHIIVGGRHQEAVDNVVSELPNASPFVVDLTDEEATATAVSQLDHLDVLINSAGVSAASPGDIASQPRDEWRRVLEINVVAVADLTRLVLPLLRASHGDVIMINSGSGFLRTPASGGVYAASKYALRALTHALREEERGVVQVTSIHPSRVDAAPQSTHSNPAALFGLKSHLMAYTRLIQLIYCHAADAPEVRSYDPRHLQPNHHGDNIATNAINSPHVRPEVLPRERITQITQLTPYIIFDMITR